MKFYKESLYIVRVLTKKSSKNFLRALWPKNQIFFFFFFAKKSKTCQKHEINQKSEKTVLKYMYLDGFGIFLKIFVHDNFLTFVHNYFGSKNMFLAIFQKTDFSQKFTKNLTI